MAAILFDLLGCVEYESSLSESDWTPESASERDAPNLPKTKPANSSDSSSCILLVDKETLFELFAAKTSTVCPI